MNILSRQSFFYRCVAAEVQWGLPLQERFKRWPRKQRHGLWATLGTIGKWHWQWLELLLVWFNYCMFIFLLAPSCTISRTHVAGSKWKSVNCLVFRSILMTRNHLSRVAADGPPLTKNATVISRPSNPITWRVRGLGGDPKRCLGALGVWSP